jgi:glycerol-3-phosphate dehydrogenase
VPLPFDRASQLDALAGCTFDVLVVGGGITGAGVALDAASRGLTVAIVERHDWASGTSSKSSKLVHGGLRYLQQGDVRLVYEALHERQRLRRNAPHLVSVLPFMIPVLTKDGVVSRKIARALGSAMWMYDVTGGWRIGKIHRRLRRDAAFAHLPTMPKERLASAYLYYDAAVDDARLVITVVRTAVEHGAVAVNRCAVAGLTHGDDTTTVALDTDRGRIECHARVVINAAGVWADDVRALDEGRHPDSIRPAKGVHLTVPWHKVRNDIAVVIPVPKDRRSLFVVPWGPLPDGTFQHTYVGTTDTDYQGPIDDPQCTKDDIDYVLRALNASVTTGITVDDVTGVWAGLRPLVKVHSGEAEVSGRTADLSRRHHVAVSDHGVISVTGGKLTTYREMAEDAVDVAAERLGRRAKGRTKRLRLLGAESRRSATAGTRSAHLAGRYGSLSSSIEALVSDDPTLGEPLVVGLPYLRAEAVYATRHEQATSLDDVLSRRTRALLLDRAATEASAPAVAALLAAELGWDDHERDRQLAEFVAMCAHERHAGTLTESEFLEA